MRWRRSKVARAARPLVNRHRCRHCVRTECQSRATTVMSQPCSQSLSALARPCAPAPRTSALGGLARARGHRCEWLARRTPRPARPWHALRGQDQMNPISSSTLGKQVPWPGALHFWQCVTLYLDTAALRGRGREGKHSFRQAARGGATTNCFAWPMRGPSGVSGVHSGPPGPGEELCGRVQGYQLRKHVV